MRHLLPSVAVVIFAASLLAGLAACQGYIGTEHAPSVRLGANANEAEQTQLDRDAGLLLKKDPANPTAAPVPVPPLPPQSTGVALSDLILIGLSILGVTGTGVAVAAKRKASTIGAVALDVAKGVVAEFDAKPFTPNDVASIEAARASVNVPKV